MSVLLTTSNNGVLGIQPYPVILSCRNKDSAAIPQYTLVRLDFAQTSEEAGTGSSAVGVASNSKWANVTLAPTTTAASTGGIYGAGRVRVAVTVPASPERSLMAFPYDGFGTVFVITNPPLFR